MDGFKSVIAHDTYFKYNLHFSITKYCVCNIYGVFIEKKLNNRYLCSPMPVV